MDSKLEEARRWVRKKRVFYTAIVVYLTLVVFWFLIDVLTDSGNWWFYWPTLGAGIVLAIIGISMFGVSGLFGSEWEQREMDKYLRHHGGGSGSGQEQATLPPAPGDSSS